MTRCARFVSCPKQSGFTLIELLVVISIIALLISILLPALGAARETAVMIKCSSQHRSVAQAVHMYATDRNTYYPPMWDPTVTRYPTGWAHWTDVINTYLGLQDRPDGNPAGGYGLIARDSGLYTCPALEEATVLSPWHGLYGPNPWIMPYGWTATPFTTRSGQDNADHPNEVIHEALTESPSQTMLTLDRKSYHGAGMRNYEFRGMSDWTVVCQPHFRTQGLDWVNYSGAWELGFNAGQNVHSFLDGHAASNSPEDFNHGVVGYDNYIIE
jgi:prepilin-type N-terminal cleavage/methylation domain-containing protein